MTDANETTRYVAIGSVTGWCGHQHRTWEAAQVCADKHDRACRSLGKGVYSDRRVMETSALAQCFDGSFYL